MVRRVLPWSMRRPSPQTATLLVTALAFHVDMLLYYLLVPLLPRYAEELHLNPLEVSLLFGSYAVGLLAATLPIARITDHHGRRKPMLWGLAGLGATTLVFAFSRNFSLLVGARFLQGVSGSATWLPGMALLADHFPSESRGRAMGTAFAAANLGVLLGPPLSGFLDQHMGPSSPFLVGAALVALDAMGRLFLLSDTEPAVVPRIPFRQLLSNPVIRLFAGAMALGSALWALLESTLPIDLHARLGLSPSGIGFGFAAMALAHTLTSPLIGRLSDKLGRVRALRMGLVLVALLLALPALLPKPWMVIGAMMTLGSAASFIMSPCSPAVADQVERQGSQGYASAFSILNLSYAIGMMVGPLVGGVLVQGLGPAWALGLSGLGFAVYLMAARRITV